VFAAYASRRGRALVDRELYLPKSWTDHPDRCRAARIPEQRVFATKPEIARAMVTRVLAAGMPVDWVSADEAYGADFKFRRMCEIHGAGYVLAVPKSQQVRADGGIWRIDAMFADAPEPAWERMSCGDGAKGPRVYDWAAARLPAVPDFDGEEPTHDRWILARRSLDPDKEIAYYLAYAPAGTPVAELVRVAGARWTVEECFGVREERLRHGRVPGQTLSGLVSARHLGDARPRVPGRPGRRRGRKGGSADIQPYAIALSVAEIRRLMAALTPPLIREPVRHVLARSTWRRQRQAVAQACHHRRRTAGRDNGHRPRTTIRTGPFTSGNTEPLLEY
jgi:hypothetical protein